MPLDALRQPIRVRILEICTEWERISPSEMVADRLCADVETIRGKTPEQALTNIAYHCRKLAQFGFLTVVDEEQKRGATKHYYGANAEALFDTEEWSAMPEAERRAISRVVWQRLIAQVEGSMQQHTFDARTDRWLAWGPLDLDERGWNDLMKEISDTYDTVERIRRQTEARLAKSGEAPLRATYALFGFESPKRPSKRRRKPDDGSDPKNRHRSPT